MLGTDPPPSDARPGPRRIRLTLRGVMLFIAIFALSTTVAIQSLRLRESQVREERLRAQMELERARAIQAQLTAVQAEVQLRAKMTQDASSKAPDPPSDR